MDDSDNTSPNSAADSPAEVAPQASGGNPPITTAATPVAELISPAANTPLAGSPSATYTSQAEWEADRRTLADVAHNALNNFLKSSVHQRADLLRDTLAVAVTLLIGSLTLYFTQPANIKTIPLFFTSVLALVIGIVANLIARGEIVRHLQDVSFQIEKNYITVYGASREVLKMPSVTNIDTAWRVERETPPFPILKRRGLWGHSIAIWTIVIAIVGFTISFVFKIT